MLMKASLISLFVTSIVVTIPIFAIDSGKIDGQLASPALLRAVNSINNGYMPMRYSTGDVDALEDISNLSPITSNRLPISNGRWLLIENPLLFDPSEVKRAAQSFTPWAGKRSSEEGKRVFHSWAGKRSNKPFSNWAGKRDAEEAPNK